MSFLDSRPNSELLPHLLEDQSARWHRGERVPIESYLDRYPHLASDTEAVVDLVYAEVLLRVERREKPTLDEYLQRFSQHADALRRRWDVHRLVVGTTADSHLTRSEPTAREGGARPRPPEIPGYEILGRVKAGGMGVVYRARQLSINRVVALKTVLDRHLDGEGALRFRREAEAVGRLSHPHVVPVHDFGECDGVPYLAMEFMAGGSLHDLLKAGPLEPRRAAELVAQAARGVQAAHEAKIVHRDLKPGNILLDAQGRARVADFGLARLEDRSDGLTRTGAAMGTRGYMAPEQARGEKEVGPAADVWALGAVLYACLTGRPPLPPDATDEQARAGKVVRPRALRPDVPAPLEAVCLSCLRRRPEHRYPSAAAVAEQLQRFLDEKPVVPTAPPREWPAWVRPWQVALVVLAAVLGGAAVGMGPDGKRDDPVARLKERLGQGKPVELIGRGQPRWSRVLVGKRSAQPRQEDGSFAVVASGLCLVELTPAVPHDRYLLRADVKHVRAAHRLTGIGLYVAHKAVDRPQAPAHLFTRIAFDDSVDVLRQYDDEAKAKAKEGKRMNRPRPAGNAVTIRPCMSAGLEWTEGHSFKAPGVATACFIGHGGENGPWRTLEVEVTPEGVRCFWVGGAKRSPAGVLSRLEHLEDSRRLLPLMPPQSRLFGIEPEYVPGGGVGLYVERGTGAFRNVVIRPLRE